MATGFWGFYEKANNVIRTFTGPADIGAGHPEAPLAHDAAAPCPICGSPMTRHTVLRTAGNQHEPTRLVCPA